MSGIAEVLLNLGYRCRGSDLADSAAAAPPAGLGLGCFMGHARRERRAARDAVVTSTAVKRGQPRSAGRRARGTSRWCRAP